MPGYDATPLKTIIAVIPAVAMLVSLGRRLYRGYKRIEEVEMTEFKKRHRRKK